MNNIIKCNIFPCNKEIKENQTFEIIDKNVVDYTHVIHKYPSKYIPQIPRWAILEFSKKGDIILDPFIGSGTTLIESILNERNGLGFDVNPVAVLISKVKTTPINPLILEECYMELVNKAMNEKYLIKEVVPDIPNINHWFEKISILNLSKLKYHILQIREKNLRHFFLVLFSAIIRKTSNAEYRSQKTYVSSRFKKEPADVFKIFERRFYQYLDGMGSLYHSLKNKNVLSDVKLGYADKFSLDTDFGLSKKIDLAITSPPYITAVHYPSVFKLEYQWLDYFKASELNEHRQDYIGTDRCYADQYNELHQLGYKKIDKQLEDIFNKDRKKSYIVYNYFRRMEKNIIKVKKHLKKGGIYIIVIGNNSVMNLKIPISYYLVTIAENNGFQLYNRFSYLIKDRHLIIPRKGNGGFIKKDWIVILEKQ